MYFGLKAVAECEGCILAHSFKSENGKIRKGQRLTSEHLLLLQTAGVAHITVAQLDVNDVHEDSAALQIATALAGSNTRIGAAATGRVNLHATTVGLCEFDPSVIFNINTIDEKITVATLPQSTRVAEGQMVATVKIIPFAVPADAVTEAVSAADRDISIQPMTSGRACLIQTELPAVSSTALDKARRATEHRLLERNSVLTHEIRASHTTDAVLASLQEAIALDVDWILVIGASAISDRQDIIPAAITSLGGTIERFGMPVDPGNLLLFARLSGKTVIGMPGCARSPKYNGLDQVLDRMACRVPVTNSWIASLGIGGLLNEIPDRPRPRAIAASKPEVSALVLAAGSSSRFGNDNKLLSEWQGRSLIQHVTNAVANSKVTGITVVTGFDRAPVEASVNAVRSALPIKFIHNEAFSTGMASSLVKGVSASIESDAIIVCLADMPRITSLVINRLIEAFMAQSNKAIYFPVVRGRRGNPVLITRRLFDSILLLDGDSGARVLAQQFPDVVCEVTIEDNSILQDVDTKEELEDLSDGTAHSSNEQKV